MTFFKNFKAQNNLQAILYLMATEIIGFLDIFTTPNDHLVIGFLMDTEIFEFWPNLCPWQLFNEGNRQCILADFATPFFKLP